MSNLFTIWSPKGEKFEVSKPNFEDLRVNYGWTPTPPTETSPTAIATATKDKTNGEEAKPVHAEGSAGESAVSDPSGAGESEHAASGESAEGSEAGEGSSSGSAQAEVTKEALIESLAKFNIVADKRKSISQLQALLTEAEEATGKSAE